MIELELIHNGGDIEDSEGAWENFRIVNNGVEVGSMMVQSWNDGSALIERIDIDEEFQGQGFGAQAIQETARRFDRCFIVPDNERAQRLYERIGSETSDDVWCSLDQGFGVYRV